MLEETNKTMHAIRSTWLVFTESVRAFFENDGLTAASSLAFFSTIAMIPALFLLTYLNRFSEGISSLLTIKTRTVLEEFIPAGSTEVLDSLLSISAPDHAVGIINLAILLWSITPLISAIRRAFSTIFKTQRKHIYFMVKLLDILLVSFFIFGYAAIATSGVLLRLLPGRLIPSHFETLLPFIVLTLIVFVSYIAFSPKTKLKYLLVSAVASTSLWFLLRPAFNLFLTYNAGFGFMFGSLKSIFVVVLWIYISQCIYLFGAEITASLRRREAMVIKKLMDGKKPGHVKTVRSLLIDFPPGEVIVTEGEDIPEMYYIKSGTVAVIKDGTQVAELGEGRFLGEMSFLLNEPRSASVHSTSSVVLIRISRDNFNVLTREFPEIVDEMLREMASRLRSTTELAV
ncbi:MAG: YihY/virulence factor BrkB family protein [Thermodesulfovibrionales bacterium]|nr:YihY/virulence factor BrkB family protein [Thermodesulfovibrionales bacterium]